MIKHLLRKIFFCGDHAKGVFLGLTLLLFLAWCGFTACCWVLVVNCHAFSSDAASVLLSYLPLLFITYILFLVFKGIVIVAMRTPRFWKRLLKMLAAIAVLAPICSLIAFCLLPVGKLQTIGFYIQDSLVELAIFNTLMLAVIGIGYLFKPIVHPVKLPSIILLWTCSYLVFSTLLILANPLAERMPTAWHYPHWFGMSVPYVIPCWKLFNLNGIGCFGFTLAGFLMVAVAYIMSWNVLAKFSGCSMRCFCGRCIRAMWCVMAGCYALTFILAVWNSVQYHGAVRELEEHFGHKMTGTELGRIYYDGRTPDSEYWKKVDDATRRFHVEQEKLEDCDGYEFYEHPDAVLPRELYERRRKAFSKGVESMGLGNLFAASLRPDERDYADGFLIAMQANDLIDCRRLAEIEQRRCYYAIDDGDLNTAAESIAQIDMLCDYLCKDSSMAGWLAWRFVGKIRNDMLGRMLEAGMASDGWLEVQSKKLLQWEKIFENSEQNVLYSEAVIVLDVFQRVAEQDLKEESNYWICYKSIRFFFPQGWWLAAKSAKEYARVMKVSSFDQLPEKPVGNAMVDIFVPALVRGGNAIRTYLASCRVLRGLIAVELQKRRTGDYPDALELPIDPFTGKQLKYRKGSCKVLRHYCKWEPCEEDGGKEADDDDSASQGRWIFEQKEETVEGVQIWSVGPDGIDDGGINRTAEYGSEEKSKDDIRHIIPLR